MQRKNHQRGAMLITASLFMFLLIAIAVTAVNVGRITIVRNELQNGADAAALAGALCLNKPVGVSGFCQPAVPTTAPINWAGASNRATTATSMNSSDNTALSANTIRTDYWNLQTNDWSGAPPSPITISWTLYNKPAVQVKVLKNAGLLNGSSFGSQASGVAVVSNPGIVSPGSLFPLAMNKCLYDLYWHNGHGDLAPSNASINGIAQQQGQPIRFKVGANSPGAIGACTPGGQWTSFIGGGNGDADINLLLDVTSPGVANQATGNNTLVNIDDQIHIRPSSSIGSALSGTESNGWIGKDVLIPIVYKIDSAEERVYAFASIRIFNVCSSNQRPAVCSGNSSDKYVLVYFNDTFVVPVGAGGIGPNYGAYTPPRLAQ